MEKTLLVAAIWCQSESQYCFGSLFRAKAWLSQRDFVGPEDIQDIAFDVLRHRLILSYEAEAEGITTDHFIKTDFQDCCTLMLFNKQEILLMSVFLSP